MKIVSGHDFNKSLSNLRPNHIPIHWHQSETETKSKSGSTSSNSASMPFDSDMNHHANNPLDEVISKMGVTAHEKSLLVAEHE